MKFLAKPTEVTKIEADVLAVFAYLPKDSEVKATKAEVGPQFVFFEEAKRADQALSGMLGEVAQVEEFEAKVGNTLLIHSHGRLLAKRVLLVGLGKLKELTMADLLTASASLGRAAKKVKATTLAVPLSPDVLEHFGTAEASQGLVEGISLGTYEFLRHKSEEEVKKHKPIDEVYLLTAPGRLNAVSAGIERGQIAAAAVGFARDLVNEPPSVTTPTYLANVARSLVKGKTALTCEVLDRGEMEKLGMGGLLGIARGSSEEPKFIVLRYRGGSGKTVCLVGKGITFDTGGLSLKSSLAMETMKLDMAGGAAILGIFKALAQLKPKLNVVGLIAATENMPGDRAIKPGDVVRAMTGKTIEILNTDAEGRVILADALSYAGVKVKPDILIDLATLTGACMVALGEEIAGLFGSAEKLITSLKDAAKAAGERVWEMPLAKDYQELLKSKIADVKNSSDSKYGGAINGALFLQEFVPEGVPWAHLDIAGPAFAEKDKPLTPCGGTGFGVRLILRFLLNYS